MADNVDEVRSQDGEVLQRVLHPRGRRYAGQPFDFSSRHSVSIVPPEHRGEPSTVDDGFVVVDYFYHLGRYWRARIPLDGVHFIYAEAFNFSQPKTRLGTNGPELILDHQGVPRRKISALNHIQSRFKFDAHQPVQLYPLHGVLSGPPCHVIDDIVYSIEAVSPFGVRFNIRDALLGNLIVAHRLLSTHEMVFERIVLENMYVVESPPLPLDGVQRRAALIASVQRSHRAGMNETYYLYRCFRTNNCTSSPLREIDRIVKYSFRQRIATLLYRLPLNPRLYLRLRGLDSDPTVRRLVSDEFAAYIKDPDTVRRKREVVRAHTKARRADRDAKRALRVDSSYRHVGIDLGVTAPPVPPVRQMHRRRARKQGRFCADVPGHRVRAANR